MNAQPNILFSAGSVNSTEINFVGNISASKPYFVVCRVVASAGGVRFGAVQPGQPLNAAAELIAQGDETQVLVTPGQFNLALIQTNAADQVSFRVL